MPEEPNTLCHHSKPRANTRVVCLNLQTVTSAEGSPKSALAYLECLHQGFVVRQDHL